MAPKLARTWAAAALALILITSATGVLWAQYRTPSPDKKLYAVRGKGQSGEQERFEIFTSDQKPVSVLHIWLTEPKGTLRTGIRGCDGFGWVDSTRFFCEGSMNPSSGIYRWFDAISGKELGEAIGKQFTWSPHKTTLAFCGNVPHFTDAASKSDSLIVGEWTWPGGASNVEQHWFRSAISWSPEGKLVAIIDHQRRVRKAFFLEILSAATGTLTEHKLRWPSETDEWPAAHDFQIEWTKTNVVVRRAGEFQYFPR